MIHVSIDGACRSNGQINPTAAIGVHFEQYPEESLGKVLRIPQPTNQKAELIAAIRGLERSFVLANMLASEEVLNQGHSSKGGYVVQLKADSEYVIKGIYEWIPKWKQNGYRTSRGRPVVNSTLFRHLEDLVYKAFPEMGWSVEAVHIPREQNFRADALANSALDEKSASGIGEPLYATWICSNMPSQHMCHQRELFTEFTWMYPLELETHKLGPTAKPIYAIGTGTIRLQVMMPDGTTRRTLVLEDVLYAPDILLNLVAEKRIPFNHQSFSFVKGGEVVAYAPIRDGLFVIQRWEDY